MPPLPRVRFAGTPALLLASGVEQALSPRDALLLLRVAAQPAVSRRKLAAWLWPDVDARRAAISLRQRLFRLQQRAGRPLVLGQRTLMLDAGIAHDLADGADSMGEGGTQAELLDVDLSGLGEESLAWLEAQREARRQQRAELMAQRAETLAGAGRLAEALPAAEQLARERPELEHAHRRVMRLHFLRGDLAAALAAYRRCREFLATLGVEPGPETEALACHIDGANRPSVAISTASAPLPLLRPPRLVGRAAEWQRIDTAWQAQHDVLVSAEPGLGKSRLLGAFATAARVPLVNSGIGDRELTYGLLARLVRSWHCLVGSPHEAWAVEEVARFVPSLGVPAEGAVHTHRIRDAIAAWAAHVVARGIAGTAVDDLQFADSASIEVLLATIDRPTELRWLLAVRANEHPPAITAWLPGAKGTEQLVLAPLGEDGIAELVESLGLEPARWTSVLLRRAGGHPLLTLQLLQHGIRSDADGLEALAPSAHLGELLERRLLQLSPRALHLAQIAALAPNDFSPELAAELLALPVIELAPAWRELEAAHVFAGAGLAHDLVREAAERTVPTAVAAVVHRELAVMGPRLGMPAVRQARHWLAAGADAPAAQALLRAADEALRLSRRAEEAGLLDEALVCLARVGDAGMGFLALERRVAASRYVDRYDRQLELADQLVALARDDEEQARALLARADLKVDGQRFQSALDDAEIVPASAASAQRDVARVRARALTGLTRVSEALAALEAHRKVVLAAPAPADARFLSDLGVLLIKSDRPREAWPLLCRARALAEVGGDWGMAAEVAVNLGWVLTTLEQVRRALVCYEHARRMHQRTGADHSPSTMHFVGLARLYRRVGRYDLALELLEAITREQRATAGYHLHTVADHDLALAYLQLGRPALALQALGGGDAPPRGSYQPSWLLARGRIALWAGQCAEHWLRIAWDLARTEVPRESRWVAGAELAMSLPPEAGASLASALLAEVGSVDTPLAECLLRAVWCDRLLAAGQTDEAAHVARGLLAAFRHRVPASMHAPHFWCVIAEALSKAGDAEAAATAVHVGRRWVRGAIVPAVFAESFGQRNPFVRRLSILPC